MMLTHEEVGRIDKSTPHAVCEFVALLGDRGDAACAMRCSRVARSQVASLPAC